LRLRGDVFSLDGRLDEAIAAFKKANAINPMEPAVLLPMVQALFQSNQAVEAEKLAQGCIQRHKDFGPIYDVLFNHYRQTKRLVEAEGVLQSKITNLPKDPSPV